MHALFIKVVADKVNKHLTLCLCFSLFQSNLLCLFVDLLKELNVELKGPFNYAARDEAGIPRDWYDEW